MFDSGVGGLTVLHELLVSLPDRGLPVPRRHGALPVRRPDPGRAPAFAIEIAEHLLEAGAKLLVVACNAASSAALDALERARAGDGREIDVIGVVEPATQLAVAGSEDRADRAARDPGDGRERRVRAGGAQPPTRTCTWRAWRARTSRRSSRAGSRSTSDVVETVRDVLRAAAARPRSTR